MLAPLSGIDTKLKAGVQQQSFPYPTVYQNRFCKLFSALMAKSWAQTLSFQSVTDKKRQIFFAPGGARSLSLTKIGVVIQEVHTILVPLKCFASDVHFRR